MDWKWCLKSWIFGKEKWVGCLFFSSSSFFPQRFDSLLIFEEKTVFNGRRKQETTEVTKKVVYFLLFCRFFPPHSLIVFIFIKWTFCFYFSIFLFNSDYFIYIFNLFYSENKNFKTFYSFKLGLIWVWEEVI